MRLLRFYLGEPLAIGALLHLNTTLARRITTVLRLTVNDQLILFNPHLRQEVVAKIIKINHHDVTVKIIESLPLPAAAQLAIFLGQGVSRGDKMDFTWQKAVELGGTDLTPLFTQYCNVQLQGERLTKKLEHWQGVIINALEQSGRCDFPTLHPASTLNDWVKTVPAELKLILDPHAPLKFSALPQQTCRSVALLIGSEGGLSPAEIELAKNHGFIAVTLGSRVLRTETAALATMSALQLKYGDF